MDPVGASRRLPGARRVHGSTPLRPRSPKMRPMGHRGREGTGLLRGRPRQRTRRRSRRPGRRAISGRGWPSTAASCRSGPTGRFPPGCCTGRRATAAPACEPRSWDARCAPPPVDPAADPPCRSTAPPRAWLSRRRPALRPACPSVQARPPDASVQARPPDPAARGAPACDARGPAGPGRISGIPALPVRSFRASSRRPPSPGALGRPPANPLAWRSFATWIKPSASP